MLDETFTYGNTEYQVTGIDEMEGLSLAKKELIANDKEPRIYFAGKILKSGKVSKNQGGMFYRFNSGRFIKVL